MRMLEQVLERARQRRAEAEAALFELIAIPSVSALPEHRDDCRRAADWLVARFTAAGMQARLVDGGEGEHQTSSHVLPRLLRAHAADLATDYLLVGDGGFLADGLPSLVTGLRGLLYTEIEVVGPSIDLHSGIFGGVAPNPFNSLAHVLAGLKDRDGVVQVPGFYDDVEPP